MLARLRGPARRRARRHLAGGRDVEDGLAALSRGLPVGFLVGAGRGAFGGVYGGRRGRDGEERALVGFGVADEGGDVVAGEERVGEDLGRRETGQDQSERAAFGGACNNRS